MTQRSQPAADHVTNFPTSDAGPYSADEWSDMFASLFSGDEADQGPLVRYLNELEVTLNVVGPPPEFRVDTGGAVSDGHWFKNDATVDFTITAPAANPRIDRVVVLVNNTNALVTVSDLGFTLDFPDVLTDYNLTASVEPYTARLVIVQGTEAVGPVAPGLDQNANHFMIPLYQYQISVAGAISGAVDQREYCRFSSGYGIRYDTIAITGGWNTTDAIALQLFQDGWEMPDLKDCSVYGFYQVPIDYDGAYTIQVMIRPGATGNLRWNAGVARARCTDNTRPTTTTGPSTTAVVQDTWTCLTLSTQAVSAGDVIIINFRRDGANAADTIGDIILVTSFLFDPDTTLL